MRTDRVMRLEGKLLSEIGEMRQTYADSSNNAFPPKSTRSMVSRLVESVDTSNSQCTAANNTTRETVVVFIHYN